ncbi:MAG: glycosyltransferase family 4 protein, partial [Acidobacteriota bacterium]
AITSRSVLWAQRLAHGTLHFTGCSRHLIASYAGNGSWHVVYNGVPLPKESESKIDKKPFGAGQLLLCVARVSRWKRHDIVLDVFRDLAERFPDLHLALAGGADPDDEEWWHRIQRLSLEHPAAGRIHWLGMADELSAWYRASDVLLLASEREPFGRVLIEAMAHGLPVVASRGGGVPEIVEDGRQGFLPEPGDVEGMTKAVRQLLSDPELQKRMGKLGVKRARLFSLEAHVEGVRGVYDRVLKPKDAR